MLTDRGMLKWGIRPSRPVAFSGSEGRVPDRSIVFAQMIEQMENERNEGVVRKESEKWMEKSCLYTTEHQYEQL